MKKRILAFIMVLAMLIGIGLPSQEVKAAGGVSASWGMSGGSQAFYISNGSSETVWCDVYVVGGSRDMGPNSRLRQAGARRSPRISLYILN